MENGTFAPDFKGVQWSKGLKHRQGARIHKRMHIGAVLPEPSPLACTKYRGRGRLGSGW